MTIAKRLAQLEARRVKAGVPEAIDPDLMCWIMEFGRRHGSYDPVSLSDAEIAHWAQCLPATNLPDLLALFARIDALI